MEFINESELSLGKLKRLFNFATQNIKDDELLGDVYDEWLNFIRRGVVEIEYQVAEDAKQNEEDFGAEEPSQDILTVKENLNKALKLLEKKEFRPFDEKILALNNAIQVWHRDVPILEHYLRDYYSGDVRDFLNWLQNVNTGMLKENNKIRRLIKECLDEIFCEGDDFVIDEMAYPTNFNFEEFKNIKSFAGKQKYARERLLGKVGAGSSRAVFKIDDEKVLKVALNQKGLSQNMAEAEGYKQNYDVLARVFDVDYDDMWVEMELAKKISPRRFKELTGTSPEDVSQWLAYQRGQKTWGNVADLKKLKDNDFAVDLENFTGDYQYPVPGDFGRISTYGEVLRDGKPTVVVIDFGFNTSTEDIYKSSINKKRAYAY